MDYNHQKLNICYVCGYSFEDFLPWGEDGKHPQYGEFCPSCGTEFGYEDSTVQSTKAKRELWIDTGMQWWDIKQDLRMKPAGWNAESQLKNIPEEYL